MTLNSKTGHIMPHGVPLPQIDLPPSTKTVKVSIIDTTSRLGGLPATELFEPKVRGFDTFLGPSYAFLVEHEPSGDKLVFDLGMRKDISDHTPAILAKFEGVDLQVTKNVSDILEENNVDLRSIKDIIWSHYHYDHTGDPSVFPPSTNLVVGPGFRKIVGAGYPQDKDSPCASSAWENRNLAELDFTTDVRAMKTRVGRWKALDWFGDGSFYVLHSLGHTHDHLCGLARTKLATADSNSSTPKDEFILMGGDVTHHGGEYKPNELVPIPDSIAPDPRRAPFSNGDCVCPGELYAQRNRRYARDEDRWRGPFLEWQREYSDDHEEAQRSVGMLRDFDAQDNVFVIAAHDGTLLDIVDFYPKDAKQWREMGWKREAYWRFLRDFEEA